MLTSQSVMRPSPEQAQVVGRAVDMLRQVLKAKGREQELPALDAAVAEFSRGLAGAASALSDAMAPPTKAPTGMYA